MLNRDDFNSDKVDAGDVGSGQSVTRCESCRLADHARTGLRYGRPMAVAAGTRELGFVKIRANCQVRHQPPISAPIDGRSKLLASSSATGRPARSASPPSPNVARRDVRGTMNYDDVLKIARSRGKDEFGYHQ
jgi:Ca-activated chloride channel family protein